MLHVYARVSSADQIKGLSLELQNDTELLEKLATQFETTVSSRIYQDNGKSAYHGLHLKGEMGQLLSDIDNKIIKSGDIVVARHLDRISRLELHGDEYKTGAMEIYDKFMKAGVCIYTTMDNRLYKPNDSVSQILATLSFDLASEESRKKSHLTTSTAKRKIVKFLQTGTPIDIGVGKAPFYLEKKEGVIVKGSYFSAMRESIDRALSGIGSTENYKQMITDYGKIITREGFTKLLQKPCLYGKASIKLRSEPAPYELDNYYPAICTEDEYHALQALKAPNKSIGGHTRHLTNLAGIRRLYCECGEVLAAKSGNVHRKEVYHYYMCRGLKSCFSLRQEVLDKIVLEAVHGFSFVKADSSDALKQVDAARGKYDNALADFEELQAGVLANKKLFQNPTFMKQLEEEQENLEALERELELAKQQLGLTNVSNDLSQALESYQSHQLSDDKVANKAMVRRLVKRIEASKYRVKVTFIDDSEEHYIFLHPRERIRLQPNYYMKVNIGDFSNIDTGELRCKFLSESEWRSHQIKLEDAPEEIIRKAI